MQALIVVYGAAKMKVFVEEVLISFTIMNVLLIKQDLELQRDTLHKTRLNQGISEFKF